LIYVPSPFALLVKQRLTLRSLCPLILLLLGCFLAGCEPPESASSTPEAKEKIAPAAHKVANKGDLIDDSWQANFLNAAKLGFGHAVVRKVSGPAGKIIRTTMTQELRIQRYGQETKETLTFSSEDSPEGKVLSFDCQAAAMGMEASGRVSNGFLKLTTLTKGKATTSNIPWDEDTLGYFGLEDSLRRQPLKAGEKRRVKWFQPLLHMVSDDKLEAQEEEEVDLLGETKRLLKITCEGTLGKQVIRRTLWTDDKGLVWKSANIESGEENFRTSEEMARKQDGKAFDLGASTIVKVAHKLDQPHDTRRIVYRATLKHRNPAEVFSICGSQSVKQINEHTAEIAVQRVTPTEPEKIEGSHSPEAGDSAPNSLIQSDAKIIERLADSIGGNEKDPVKVAFALESGVREKMANKNYMTAFATAADVARSLEGDCTEHAVLLAALLRAKKIPARVAAGLVYVQANEDRKMSQGFAYHMWTEAWLNDRWVPLDATLGRGGIGAAHIKLSDTNLDGVSPLEALLPVMNVLGQLELEVVEVE
jgi:hypothetical protein